MDDIVHLPGSQQPSWHSEAHRVLDEILAAMGQGEAVAAEAGFVNLARMIGLGYTIDSGFRDEHPTG